MGGQREACGQFLPWSWSRPQWKGALFRDRGGAGAQALIQRERMGRRAGKGAKRKKTETEVEKECETQLQWAE